VFSSLTGDGLEATFESLQSTHLAGGRHTVAGCRAGDRVSVRAFGHAPQDIVLETGDNKVALAPVRVDPETVFGLLEGFTFAEVPDAGEGGLGRFDAAFGPDGPADSPPLTAARFLIHQSLVATLLVISMEPADMGGSDRLRRLAGGFGEATGSPAEELEIQGERAYSGHPADGLTWIALARHSVLFVVIAEDEGFANGVARSILKQIR
jgi:hypothetical protein